jgi:hypothetical protein
MKHPKLPPDKKKYNKPQLLTYGNIQGITQSSGKTSKHTDGGKGASMDKTN